MLTILILSACTPQTDEETKVEIENTFPTENNGDDTSPGVNETSLPLEVPEGFKISEWVTGVSGARVLVGPDQLGNYWLSRTKQGIVSNIQIDENGNVENVSDIFTGLNQPHGLALDPESGMVLYIAETDKISMVELYTEGQLEKLADFPAGGRHYTRTLLFGPDDRLYISIGSSCDTCTEGDERYATIYVMDKNGENFEEFADGLRNAVFMATDPVTGEIWATEMGRDFLGDDLPPDEINIIADGKDYGWPYCYGNQVRDSQFKSNEMPDYCETTEPAKIELQAHSAPLGLAFIPEEGWPEEMWLDLIVAYHGSWNRSEPTGYKLMWIQLDDERNEVSREDFITGWLSDEDEKLGRPVDVWVMPGGLMYVTDDKRGVIYKIEYLG